MNIERSELKPCPFCGGIAELSTDESCGDAIVICTECLCKTRTFLNLHKGCKPKENAIRAWNKRIKKNYSVRVGAIEEELANRGMSKQQLAFDARISPSDLYRALNGTMPLYPAWRTRIAEALGVPEEILFEKVVIEE